MFDDDDLNIKCLKYIIRMMFYAKNRNEYDEKIRTQNSYQEYSYYFSRRYKLKIRGIFCDVNNFFTFTVCR